MKFNNYFLFLFLLLFGLFLLSGCGGKITYSDDKAQVVSDEEQLPEIQTLSKIYIIAKNWDADAEIDGIEFDLSPRDRDNRIIPSSGTVDVKLWEEACVKYYEFTDFCEEAECGKDNPTDTWTVPITQESYDSIFGATLRLDYKNYVVTDDKEKKGCAEIKFTTGDGKPFIAKDDIYLNGL